MGLEAPVGRTVHTGGSESAVHAQLVLAGLNVVGDLLQGLKVGDVGSLVTGLLQQLGVGDQAVSLDDVSHAVHRVAFLQREGIGGQVLGDVRILEIIAVVLPVGQADRAVDLEQRRRIALLDLAHQRGFIVAGSGRHDGHRHAGLLGVELGELLPLGVLLRLEVQIVNRTVGRSAHGQSKAQARGQSKSDDFLHDSYPFRFVENFYGRSVLPLQTYVWMTFAKLCATSMHSL